MKSKVLPLAAVTAVLLTLGFYASPAAAVSVGLGAAADFAVLVTNGGTLTINSATTLIGDVGYSRDSTSATNQKVTTFTGGVFVHSTANFSYTAATFDPSEGFHYGSSDPAVDLKLDSANADALAASATIALLSPTHTETGAGGTVALGALLDRDVVINRVAPVNVINLSSIDLNSDTLILVGEPNDLFLFNVASTLQWSDSRLILEGGVSSAGVLFNFPNGAGGPTAVINKSGTVWRGTILAPGGSVIYHNPADFEGEIIAKNIDLHSEFNLTASPLTIIPEPATTLLVGSGIVFGSGILLRRRMK